MLYCSPDKVKKPLITIIYLLPSICLCVQPSIVKLIWDLVAGVTAPGRETLTSLFLQTLSYQIYAILRCVLAGWDIYSPQTKCGSAFGSPKRRSSGDIMVLCLNQPYWFFLMQRSSLFMLSFPRGPHLVCNSESIHTEEEAHSVSRISLFHNPLGVCDTRNFAIDMTSLSWLSLW